MSTVRTWVLLGLAVIPVVLLATLTATGLGLVTAQLVDLHVTLIGVAVALASAFGILALRAHLTHGDARTLAIGAALVGFAAVYVWHGVFTHSTPPFRFLIYGPASRVVFALALLGLVSERTFTHRARLRNVAVASAGAGILAAVGYAVSNPLGNWAAATSPVVLQSIRVGLEGLAAALCVVVIALVTRNREPTDPRGPVVAGILLTVNQSIFFLPAGPWSFMWWTAHALGAAGVLVLSWATLVVLQESAHAGELKALRLVERERVAFLNATAHELKTPLTPVRIQLHLLTKRAKEFDASTQRSLQTIERNVVRLSALVDTMLASATSQSKRSESNHSNLSSILGETLNAVESEAANSSIHIQREIDPDINVRISGAEAADVVSLFLKNAISGSAPGSSIQVTARREKDMARVHIFDGGTPLSKEAIPRAFLPFSEASGGIDDQSRSMSLYLARRIAEANDGHVWCGSHAGARREFGFELPLASPKSSKRA